MRRVMLVAILLAAFLAAPIAAQERQRLVIATGSVTGLYYAAGNAVCRVLDRRPDNRFDCRVIETRGSGDNLAMLRSGRADLALAQSDVLATRPGTGKRLALAFLYPEVFQVVVHRDLGLETATDIVDHRFNIGLPRSGTRATLAALLAGLDISIEDFASLAELSAAENADAFCRNRIRGFAFMSGVPNSKIASILSECGGQLLGFERPAIAPFVRSRPGVDFFRFRRNTYPEMTKTLDTFAVSALLVAAPTLDEVAVREILGKLTADIDWFARLHPAWHCQSKICADPKRPR